MKGIVTKTIGGFFFVADDKQNIYKTKIRGKIQQKVYPGDYVDFSTEEKIVEGLYERQNLLPRPLVANVEQVLVIHSINNPPLDRLLLDRFLLMVESTGLKPLIVINKIDLMNNQHFMSNFNDYIEAGYDLVFISARDKKGLSQLENKLKDKLNVLAGPSGVGKSSLINSLVEEIELPTKSVSKKLKRGVHTTRHVELLPFVGGGWIADTPGFTSLDISNIPAENLTYYFPEFEEYLNLCKFRGCSHTHEPGCSVKQAVEKGEVSAERYKSYQIFYDELKDIKLY